MSGTAFILAGGASRGAYQAGCLKRLEEEGVAPDLVIGSSIGVCNALLWATGGAEHAWAFWEKAVSLPRVLDVSLTKNAVFGNSLFSMDRLTRWLESEVDFERCFSSDVELAFVLANLTAGREALRGNRTEADVEGFRAVSRAGYTIPILHPLVEIDGEQWADGGFLWNVPFEHAESWGADRVYVLSVIPSELPPAESLRTLPQVALRMYEVFWRTFGNASALHRAKDSGVVWLEPDAETGMFDPLAMLHAHPSKSKKLLWQGYRDTDHALHGGS